VSATERTLQTKIKAGDWRDVQRVLDEIGAMVEPTSVVRVSAEAEAANIRRVTLAVSDRIRQRWERHWNLDVHIAASAGGAPQNAQLVSVVSGTVIQTFLPNGHWRFEAGSDGKVVLDIEVTGAGSRWIATRIGARSQESAAIVWT
jgi:hypothetical protein